MPRRRVSYLPILVASGLMLALMAVAGLVYSSSGSPLFGPEGTIILDAALVIGVLAISIEVVTELVKYP